VIAPAGWVGRGVGRYAAGVIDAGGAAALAGGTLADVGGMAAVEAVVPARVPVAEVSAGLAAVVESMGWLVVDWIAAGWAAADWGVID
jgi:hypothetical protein